MQQWSGRCGECISDRKKEHKCRRAVRRGRQRLGEIFHQRKIGGKGGIMGIGGEGDQIN